MTSAAPTRGWTPLCSRRWIRSAATRTDAASASTMCGPSPARETTTRLWSASASTSRTCAWAAAPAISAMTSGRVPSEKLGTDSNSWRGCMRLLAYVPMPGPVVLVYGEQLMQHRLSDQHPLQPIRVKLAVDLIRSTGLMEHCRVLSPRRASDAELELVHAPAYVELVRKLSDPVERRHVPLDLVEAAGFGSADNPISDELHERTALVGGPTLVGAPALETGSAP